MLVRDLIPRLKLSEKAISKEGYLREIEGGYVGDVLSHVMANAQPGDVWITVQTHENIVAVASVVDVSCVIVCQRELPPETCQRAKKEGVTLLWTDCAAFEVCGRLYEMLRSKNL